MNFYIYEEMDIDLAFEAASYLIQSNANVNIIIDKIPTQDDWELLIEMSKCKITAIAVQKPFLR